MSRKGPSHQHGNIEFSLEDLLHARPQRGAATSKVNATVPLRVAPRGVVGTIQLDPTLPPEQAVLTGSERPNAARKKPSSIKRGVLRARAQAMVASAAAQASLCASDLATAMSAHDDLHAQWQAASATGVVASSKPEEGKSAASLQPTQSKTVNSVEVLELALAESARRVSAAQSTSATATKMLQDAVSQFEKLQMHRQPVQRLPEENSKAFKPTAPTPREQTTIGTAINKLGSSQPSTTNIKTSQLEQSELVVSDTAASASSHDVCENGSQPTTALSVQSSDEDSDMSDDSLPGLSGFSDVLSSWLPTGRQSASSGMPTHPRARNPPSPVSAKASSKAIQSPAPAMSMRISAKQQAGTSAPQDQRPATPLCSHSPHIATVVQQPLPQAQSSAQQGVNAPSQNKASPAGAPGSIHSQSVAAPAEPLSSPKQQLAAALEAAEAAKALQPHAMQSLPEKGSTYGRQHGRDAPQLHKGRQAVVGDYCDQVIDDEIDVAASALLQQLLAWQERARVSRVAHPGSRANQVARRKRLVSGLREVAKWVKSGKARAIVVAPNIEPVEGESGLSALLASILEDAQTRGMPIIFALSRKRMGQIFGWSKKMSAIAVLDASGAESAFQQLVSLSTTRRQWWRQQRGLPPLPPVSQQIPQDQGGSSTALAPLMRLRRDGRPVPINQTMSGDVGRLVGQAELPTTSPRCFDNGHRQQSNSQEERPAFRQHVGAQRHESLPGPMERGLSRGSKSYQPDNWPEPHVRAQGLDPFNLMQTPPTQPSLIQGGTLGMYHCQQHPQTAERSLVGVMQNHMSQSRSAPPMLPLSQQANPGLQQLHMRACAAQGAHPFHAAANMPRCGQLSTEHLVEASPAMLPTSAESPMVQGGPRSFIDSWQIDAQNPWEGQPATQQVAAGFGTAAPFEQTAGSTREALAAVGRFYSAPPPHLLRPSGGPATGLHANIDRYANADGSPRLLAPQASAVAAPRQPWQQSTPVISSMSMSAVPSLSQALLHGVAGPSSAPGGRGPTLRPIGPGPFDSSSSLSALQPGQHLSDSGIGAFLGLGNLGNAGSRVGDLPLNSGFATAGGHVGGQVLNTDTSDADLETFASCSPWPVNQPIDANLWHTWSAPVTRPETARISAQQPSRW